MKIVHIIGFFQPEYGYEEYYTALNQVKLGHEVHVITSDRIVNIPTRPLKERIKGVGKFEEDGIIIHRLPTFFDKINDFIITWGVSKKLKFINPDIVHCHGARQLGQFQAARKKSKLGYKLIVDHHDFVHPGHFLHPELEKSFKNFLSILEYKTFRKWLGHYILFKADQIIAVVPECKEHLIDFFNIKSDRIIVNNLAVETSLYKFTQFGRSSIRKKYNINDNEFVLLLAGWFARRKKVELYIQLVEKIVNENIRLLIVGTFDKGYKKEIIELVKKKNLEDKIIFAGKIDRLLLKNYFSACDLAIYLYNASVVWLEIMSCGVPLMGPVETQLNHLLVSKETSIRMGDINQAYKKIIFLRNNKILRKRLGEQSTKLVQQNFSYKSSTKRIMEVYHEIINEKK